jgi:origin recognition complex subunit 1
MKIIQSRLEGVPGNVVDPDAIQFASRKVAAVSGDARRALDICRRAVEIAEGESAAQEPLLATPSKRGKDGPQHRGKPGRVMISTIKQAINEATSSPLQQSLRSLPLAAKLFLAALLARIRRSGTTESVLAEVIEEAKRLAQIASEESIKENLLAAGLPGKDLLAPGKERTYLGPRVLGMGNAAADLVEAGIIGLEARKGERVGKIRLNVPEDEIRLALRDEGETRGLGFAS